MKNKKIAILSGKGGSGKTLFAVNLALASGEACYMDCDVEEPNGNLFLKSVCQEKKSVYLAIPQVNENLCNGCKKCISFCNFNALGYINKVIVFENLCHSCRGCELVCPQKCISMKNREIGVIEIGNKNHIKVVTGRMYIGVASGVKVIKETLKEIDDNKEWSFIDCPPGASCLVKEVVNKADYCLMVIEDSLYGFHDFTVIYELARALNKPFGVIINKYTASDSQIENFCLENAIEVIAKVKFKRRWAKTTARGEILLQDDVFKRILVKLSEVLK